MKKSIIMAAALLAAGCSADISPEDIRIADYKDGKECAVSFTFDDGMKEHYTVVAPELEKRGFRGTFWLCCAWINDDPQLDTTHITWAEAKEMAEKGHEMSNHSWSHPNLTELSDEEALIEIARNDDAIEEHLGCRPVTFCFPYNAYNEERVAMAMEGRIGARLKEFWFGGQHSPDEYLHKQIEDALTSRSWIAGMTHGINYGYDCYETDPSGFTRFLDYVKAMEDRVWVGTFREVAAYTKTAEGISLDVRQDGKGLVITPEVSLDPELYSTLLTMEVASGGKKIKAVQEDQPLDIICRGDKVLINFNPFGGEITLR